MNSQLAARRRTWPPLFALTLTISGIGTVAACASPGPSCGGGTQPYNGHCLTASTIAYLECTKDRGFDASSQIGGGLSGGFRDIVSVSVNLANDKTRRENSAVALQIVQDCLKVSSQEAQSGADRSVAQGLGQQANYDLQQWQQSQVSETAHITTDKTRAAAGATVTVSGTSFWPNETIKIYVSAIQVKQVQADGHGAFVTTITVPTDLVPNISTDISASGQTSAESDEQPLQYTG